MFTAARSQKPVHAFNLGHPGNNGAGIIFGCGCLAVIRINPCV
jgi:hypothetical protein